jgi:cytochrome c-type biogenesis protein CcmE
MKKWQTRATGILISLTMFCIGISLILKVFNDNVIFYLSPTELNQKSPAQLTKPFRLGGLVKEGSLKKFPDSSGISFIITDLNSEVEATYSGLVPNLFKESQGTVAYGTLNSKGIFEATEILAKHDENYMPKEVADSIKKSGQWKEN